MSVTVVGSVGLDTVKTPFGQAKKVLGGSASYFAIAAGIFAPVSLIAVIGEDFPDSFLNLFQKKNVLLEGVEKKKGKTFSWSGEYDWSLSDPKTHSINLGVFSDFKPGIPLSYQKNKYLFLANIDPCLQLHILDQIKAKRSQIIACDTMNYWIENKRKKLLKLLKSIDIFFLNESEARQLTGEPNLLKAAKVILKFGPKKIFIKKGEHGVLLLAGSQLFSAPAYLTESVVDPTGAGDSFAGGVMGYLDWSGSQNMAALKNAAIYGIATAAFAVEGFSLGSLCEVSRYKIEKRITQFRKRVSF